MARGLRGLLMTFCVLASSACDVLSPTTCTTEADPGIVVIIRSATGQLDPRTVNVRIEGKEYREEPYVSWFDDTSLVASGASERPGVYRVVIQAVGHVEWVANSVRVVERGCHVATVRLHADLLKL
jgi:hypothetical protein